MVEPKQLIRIVKAKDLFEVNDDCTCDPYVEVRVGNCRAITKTVEKLLNPQLMEPGVSFLQGTSAHIFY